MQVLNDVAFSEHVSSTSDSERKKKKKILSKCPVDFISTLDNEFSSQCTR